MGTGRSGIAKGIRQNAGGKSEDTSYKKLSWDEHLAMRQSLYDDDPEDDFYVGSNFSGNINEWLRGDGPDNIAKSVAAIDEMNSLGYQGQLIAKRLEENLKELQRTVSLMDSYMRPLPTNIEVVRFMDNGWSNAYFNTTDINQIANIVNSNKINLTDKGFLSVSTDAQANIFNDSLRYPVVLHLNVKSGTPAYITNNARESEIVIHRGSNTKLVRAKVIDGKLHIYGEVRR